MLRYYIALLAGAAPTILSWMISTGSSTMQALGVVAGRFGAGFPPSLAHIPVFKAQPCERPLY